MLNRTCRALTIAAAVAMLLSPAMAMAAADAGSSQSAAGSAASAGNDPTQAPWIELKGTQPPDIAHGKYIFKTKADCMGCHGWPGDGKTGKSPRLPEGANLRETQLDTNSLIQIVSCGIPSTAMPYHDSQAYKDGRCYGETMADFKDQTPPAVGKFLSNQDIIDVVGYVEQKIKGKGPITKAECEEFFSPGAAACRRFK